MTSLAQIKNWTKCFPFDEGELEIILRCHASLSKEKEGGSFLNTLAHSFPYVFFFLPNDEMEIRTSVVEEYILPQGFGGKFKKAIFPVEGIENEEEEIEKLINGVANCCRREPKDSLGVIFDCCCDEAGLADPGDLIDLCYRITVAAEILVSKHMDEKRTKALSKELIPLHGLKRSLSEKAIDGSKVKKFDFLEWATATAPYIYACLPTFTHNLIFHGKSTKLHHEESFVNPELLDSSNIFTSLDPSLLFGICCMAPKLGGKVS
mmetsp:Transcript_21547/g.24498  ORF Transcript_21547/g.24498 Transcript_21547/m.24498 type:complete len:264 (+) Transcript_21547:1332-2123(+)